MDTNVWPRRINDYVVYKWWVRYSKVCHYIQHMMFHQNLVCLSITNLKYKDHTSFYLLLGDVSLNPWPVQISQAVNTNILETLNKKGLYFFHISTNSLLPANKTKAAIIGITESKLDHTVPDLEVNYPGYDIL